MSKYGNIFFDLLSTELSGIKPKYITDPLIHVATERVYEKMVYLFDLYEQNSTWEIKRGNIHFKYMYMKPFLFRWFTDKRIVKEVK